MLVVEAVAARRPGVTRMNPKPQVCFVADGFMFCNYVNRNGVIVESVSGKWLKFPFRGGSIKNKSLPDVQIS
jgi:hypothetical protein